MSAMAFAAEEKAEAVSTTASADSLEVGALEQPVMAKKAKITSIIVPPTLRTNWAKIKDLFM